MKFKAIAFVLLAGIAAVAETTLMDVFEYRKKEEKAEKPEYEE